MNLILLGPPGAGKGTQAKQISSKYNLPHISTGDIFRQAVKSGSELGKLLNSYMTAGKLVPDKAVIETIKQRLYKDDCEKGFLMDGFPRTKPQAESFDTSLKEQNKVINRVICINLSENEVVKRLSGRRHCSKCGANFNIVTQPPRVGEKCDHCSADLVQRHDDNEETVKKRIKVYNDQTSPLVEYYKKTGVLVIVDGARSVEEVFKEICEIIEKQ